MGGGIGEWVARERARGECGFMKLMKLKKRGKISDVLLTAIITY
jgi:hypothetical protein